MKTIDAIDKAIQDTIDAGYLVEYLTKNKAKVRRMMLAEIKEIERDKTLQKKIGRRQNGPEDAKYANK